jgi:flagellin
MVVQHNLTAMNSNRMLGLTTKTQAKATEKLSSGYRINRAADDAAGLAISEKMRKQIRGLTQASTNAQDGISAVQTAEGALTEVHDMLQRMNELAVKAANGTQSKSDRQAIQSEINALVTEVDRVAITTKFNETYLLKGSNEGEVGKLKFTDAAGALIGGTGDSNTVTAAACIFKSGLGTTTGKGINEGTGVINALMSDFDNFKLSVSATSVGAAFGTNSTGGYDLKQLGGKSDKQPGQVLADDDKIKIVDVVDTIDADTVNKVANSTNITGTVITVNNTSYYAIYSTSELTPGKGKASVSDVINVFNEYGKLKKSGSDASIKAFASLDELMAAIKQDNGADIKTISSYYEDELNTITQSASRRGTMLTTDTKNEVNVAHNGKGTVLKIETFSDMNDAVDLSLHVGADSSSDNKINMNVAMMSARALGINGLDVSGDTATNATNAIDTIASALQMVSNQRASLGAIQNRLEHTINNLDNVVENTQSAESAIRDTDMATQMVTYSNNQILAQAGQAMLAQSNQANQGVLSLLG